MFRRLIAIATVTMLVAPLAIAATLENLQVAFTAETNDRARYLAFAGTADAEGYPSVASLFRAAARAEEVHAANHAEVIKVLGGEPKTSTEAPVVKSTAENLASAIDHETYERDAMYAEFLRIARQDNAGSATMRTLNYAQSAEETHARLFSAALHDLNSSKGLLETFYVCRICGHTTTNLRFENCPSCADPKHDYEAVH
jgi:rubrerythrin